MSTTVQETPDGADEPGALQQACSLPEPLPCPFCGKADPSLTDRSHWGERSEGGRMCWFKVFKVECYWLDSGCGAEKSAETPEEAVARWNQRAENAQWADGYGQAMSKIEYWKGCHERRGDSMGMNSYIECQIRDLNELLKSMRRDLEYKLLGNASFSRPAARGE